MENAQKMSLFVHFLTVIFLDLGKKKDVLVGKPPFLLPVVKLLTTKEWRKLGLLPW